MGDWFEGPRACRGYELPPLLDLLNRVFRVDQGRPANFGEHWAHVYDPANLDNLRLAKVGHQIVSAIAIYPTTVRAGELTIQLGGINGVATHPDFRKRGLAGDVLRDCHAKLRRDGYDLALLSTGIADWYRRFGWEHGALQRIYALDRGSVDYLPELRDAEADEGGDRDLERLRGLHEAASHAAERAPELYRVLLCRPGYRTWVARDNGGLVAYAVVRGGAVVEYGGPAEAVAGVIREAFHRHDDPGLPTSARPPGGPGLTPRWRVTTPPAGDDLGDFLERLGLPCERTYLGMLRVINARQLLAKVAPQVVVEEADDGADDGPVVLRAGAQRRVVGQRALVKLLLGPERIGSFGADALPFTFYQWPLDRV